MPCIDTFVGIQVRRYLRLLVVAKIEIDNSFASRAIGNLIVYYMYALPRYPYLYNR